MIPAKSEVSVTSNLPGESRRMDIADGALAYVMKSIIDLYSDKELAVIRELATNAYDSHVMAGNTAPIEVDTPSALSPYYVIKDQGVGLSEAEVFELFGSIGASNKRGSNDFNGMMGYGSKSPLTYTNQFTMTAVKDGVMSIVSISRDEDGVGRLTTVSAVETDEHDGVEIKIPAKTGNNFKAKAEAFFKFWKPGTVLLNGAQPTPAADGMFIADRISVKRLRQGKTYTETIPATITLYSEGNRYEGNSVVVMGNVPYPAPGLDYAHTGMPHGYYLVAEVPIGTVEFAPSREALADGRQTDEAIVAIRHALAEGLPKAIEREISKAPDAPTALRASLRWKQLMRHATALTWRGKELPTELSAPQRQTKNRWGDLQTAYDGNIYGVGTYDTGRSRVASMKTLNINHALAGGVVLVENFSFADVTPTHKKKIRQHAQKQSSAPRIYYVFNFEIPHKEFLDVPIFDWSVIQAEVLPKQTRSSSGRLAGSFDLFTGGKSYAKANRGLGTVGYGIAGDKIDQTKPVYWHHGNPNSVYQVAMVLNQFDDEYTVVCLPANRIDKFKRDYPKIKKVHDAIKDRLDTFVAKLTDEQKAAVAMQDAGRKSIYQALAPCAAELLDPDLVAAIKIAQIDTKAIQTTRQQFRRTVEWPEFKFADALLKYKLVNRLGPGVITDYQSEPELIRYLNSEYNFRNQCA